MKYAIEQLRQYAGIMSRDRVTKKVAYDFNQSAKRLELKDSNFKHSFDVYSYLEWLRSQIKKGLEGWTKNDYLDVKHRQEKRLKEVEEAVQFLSNNQTKLKL